MFNGFCCTNCLTCINSWRKFAATRPPKFVSGLTVNCFIESTKKFTLGIVKLCVGMFVCFSVHMSVCLSVRYIMEKKKSKSVSQKIGVCLIIWLPLIFLKKVLMGYFELHIIRGIFISKKNPHKCFLFSSLIPSHSPPQKKKITTKLHFYNRRRWSDIYGEGK